MTKIYACLLGNWVCLNDDPNCKIANYGQSPSLWWEEGAPIYTTELSTVNKDIQSSDLTPNTSDSFYYQNYVNVVYLGKRYRINPIHIQIVEE